MASKPTNQITAFKLITKKLFASPRWIIDVAIATIMINILAISTSIFAMQTYDRVVPTLAYTTLTTMVVGMLIVISFDWVLKILRAKILDTVASQVDMSLSQHVFNHIMHLQLDKRPRSLGTLSAQVSGLDSVRAFFSSVIIFALIDAPFALMFIFFIYIIGGPVAFVYLTLLPIAILLGWFTQLALRKLLKEQILRINERQGILVDAIRGSETIRSSHATSVFTEQWQNITQSINQYNFKHKSINNLTLSSTSSLAMLAYVFAIVVGIYQIESGNLTMGGLIACSILGGRVIAPVSRAVQQMTQWQQVSQSLQLVDNILSIDQERSDKSVLFELKTTPSNIELDQVRFSYGDSPISQIDIKSLKFSSGDRIALLGPIGSGKSTLLKILAGLYRPKEGRVVLGDVNLWEVSPEAIAKYISYLPQNVSLFKGTLQSNLNLSKQIDEDLFIQVMKDLGIDQIAAGSDQNLALEISEGGDGLSDGQRQLVGLARIFLSQPKIWLLDEPTASLDNESGQRVIKAINQYVKADDILIISTHRPMMAHQLANRVLVIKQGKIIEDGHPDNIMPKFGAKRRSTEVKDSEVSTNILPDINDQKRDII